MNLLPGEAVNWADRTPEVQDAILVPEVLPPDPDHGARSHHRFGMSKLNAYDSCSGYLPNEGTNSAAEEGTRLHEIMDRIAQSAINSGRNFVITLKTLMAEDLSITQEDEPLLYACCHEVDKLTAGRDPRPVFRNEIRVDVRKPNGEKLNHGFLDLLITFENGTKGIIFDWKFGWIPVPPAATNYQGKGYALGCFMEFSRLKHIGVVFVQPRLSKVSTCSYRRQEIPDMYSGISNVIARAKDPNPTLRPNPYCDYCQRQGTCVALVRSASETLVKYEPLPFPTNFGTGIEVRTPEDAMKALYCLQRLKAHIDAGEGALRQIAMQKVTAENGRTELPVSDTEKLVVTSHKRSFPRSISDPSGVAEALSEVMLPSQVLACCDITLGRLEPAFAETFCARQKKLADQVLEAAEKKAAKLPAKEAKELLKAAKAEARELRSSQKAAKELMAEILLQNGLLTLGEGKVEYLKLRIEKVVPTPLPETTQPNQ